MADTRALRALVRKGVRVRLSLAAPGCSSSVERPVWDRKVAGPIPVTPTNLNFFQIQRCLINRSLPAYPIAHKDFKKLD